MSHSNKKDHPVLDNSFSVLILGMTLGAIGAILLATQEGRDFTKKTLDSISDDLNIKGRSTTPIKTTPSQTPPRRQKQLHNPLKTHSSSPPEPNISIPPKPQPAPQFFRHQGGNSLKQKV